MNLQITFSLIIALLVGERAWAQVAITNPGFEEYSTCPTGISGIALATGWFEAMVSPDYYNCSFVSHPSHPSLGSGVNSPGFVGMLTSNSGGAESIGQELNEPLLPGTNYTFAFMGLLTATGNYTTVCGGIQIYGFTDPIPASPSYMHISGVNGAVLLGTSSPISVASWQSYAVSLSVSDTVNYIAITLESAPGCQQYVFLDDLSLANDHSASLADEALPIGSSSWMMMDDLLIISSSHRIDELHIFDMSGRIIHSARPGSDRVEIAQPANGIYTISMLTSAGPMQLRALSVR